MTTGQKIANINAKLAKLARYDNHEMHTKTATCGHCGSSFRRSRSWMRNIGWRINHCVDGKLDAWCSITCFDNANPLED